MEQVQESLYSELDIQGFKTLFERYSKKFPKVSFNDFRNSSGLIIERNFDKIMPGSYVLTMENERKVVKEVKTDNEKKLPVVITEDGLKYYPGTLRYNNANDFKILSKAAPIITQIKDRIDKGYKDMEIQLMLDFLENDWMTYFDAITQLNCDVHVLHMPIFNGDDISLSTLTYSKYKDVFLKTCIFANLLGKHYGHKVIIIIHNHLPFMQYMRIPSLISELSQMFKEQLKQNEYISFSFENSTLLSSIKDEKLAYVNSGFLDEAVKLANYFNKVCSCNSFGVCMDTCHIYLSLRAMKVLCMNSGMSCKYNLESFVAVNAKYCNVIHLASSINQGIGRWEHGRAFSKDRQYDIERLSLFISLFRKYNVNALMTIEVVEQDYNNATEMLKEIESLKDVLLY